MRWIFRCGVAFALVLALASSAYAKVTDGTSPSTALPLSTTAILGLNGSTAGAFRYLDFTYPTAGTPATLAFAFSPADPTTAQSVGINLWQNGALLATANGVSSTPGSNTLAFSSTSAGPILVQIYNYTNDQPVSFRLDLSGISQPTTTTAAPTVTPAPMVAATPTTTSPSTDSSKPTPLTTSASGTLPGKPAGSYNYFSTSYPGDGSTQSVTLTFSPSGPNVGSGVFVNVYQNGTLLTSSQGTDTSTPGRLTVSYASNTAGSVLIQLANFNADATITYTLSR